MPLPNGRQQLEQFSINDTTDIRMCYRCGEEGHIRKYCNTNVHCEFCKSYTHHTSVCRSYANFIQALPMASSRRISPAQVGRQQDWLQEPTEEAFTGNIVTQNQEENTDEKDRRRELPEITQKHLERVINTMIPSSGYNSFDTMDRAPVNSLVTDVGKRDTGELKVQERAKENEKQVIVNNYYIGNGEKGWKQLVGGEIPPNISGKGTQDISSEIPPNKTPLEDSSSHSSICHEEQNRVQGKRVESKTIKELMKYHSEEAETQNMASPQTYNFNYPPPARPTENQETSAMLDCIHQLQLMIQQHILTNSKQAEYHMSQNADLFTEMIKGQNRRDLDPAVMAIPTFTGQEPEKCLDWINRIKNICSKAGCPLRQELMNKSEPVVQNFLRTMGDTWTDEEVIEEILKYFSDIPTPAHAITKLRALLQGEEEAIVMYNQKYRTLVERVEGKPVEKIDSYVELEQYLGSIILPIRKSIRNNIYWKSKHAPKTLGEAMKKSRRVVHETHLLSRRTSRKRPKPLIRSHHKLSTGHTEIRTIYS